MIIVKYNTQGRVTDKLQSLKNIRKLPAMTREGMRDWGKNILVPAERRAMKSPGEIRDFRGDLSSGIVWVQPQKSNYGYLTMPEHGVMLDSMKPHPWYITRRNGMSWAAQSNKFGAQAKKLRSGEIRGFFVYVKPHPFIRSGYDNARKKLSAILKNKVDMTLNIR